MIRILHRARDGKLRTDISPAEIPGLLRDRRGLLWVDFEAEPPEACEPILRQHFGFHPLAIDDALQETHIPKVDDWESYLYIAMHSAVFEDHAEEHLAHRELDFFLAQHYLVTHHDDPIPALDVVWSRCQRDPRHLASGADHLLYLVADEVVNAYMQVFEEMDDALDMVETDVFGRPDPHTLERVFRLKRAILGLRRTLGPQREVFNKLARDSFAVIDPRDRIYFRDVYDHLVRLSDINESMRDQVSGALDTYLSVINNRMNDIMKTLTAITTLFMPISFLASFFGMNFFGPSALLGAWTGRPSFYITLGLTLLVPLGIFLWLRRQRWL
jgi:magnesium transporter